MPTVSITNALALLDVSAALEEVMRPQDVTYVKSGDCTVTVKVLNFTFDDFYHALMALFRRLGKVEFFDAKTKRVRYEDALSEMWKFGARNRYKLNQWIKSHMRDWKPGRGIPSEWEAELTDLYR